MPSKNELEEYVIRDTLTPKITEAFSDKYNITKLMKAIQRYADKWSDLLLSTDLSKRLLFSDNDKNIIYTITNISKKEVKETIKKATVIKSTWIVATNPFYILSIAIARWFKINNMENEMLAVMIYMSYVLYTSAHSNSFKHLPNKEIMDYTINNLSNRYIIKQKGTIQASIEHTIGEAMTGRFNDELIRGSDLDIKDIIYALQTRMHSFMNNIAEKFYENHKSGKYMFHEEEDVSEENFHLSDNISFKIDRVVQLVSSAIISEGFDYNTCIKRAVSLNAGASSKKLIAMLDTLIEKDMESIKDMISDILTLFIYKNTGNRIEDVGTTKFLSEALQIYKSNAQDDVTSKIKERLLNWINMTSEKYGRNFISKGKTSLDTYRRSIYTAFIFKIMETVKRN